MRLNEIINDKSKIEKRLYILLRIDDPSIYEIHEDGSVSVNDTVNISYKQFKKLTVKFRKITGTFSLESCPNLQTLEGCPDEVGGDFNCYQNDSLTSMKYMPKIIKGDFSGFSNPNLTSLEDFSNARSLNINLANCERLTSIKEIKRAKYLNITGCWRIRNMLHLLKIKDLERVRIWSPHIMFSQDDLAKKIKTLDNIINKHLSGDKDIMECQEELIDAGLEEYAHL